VRIQLFSYATIVTLLWLSALIMAESIIQFGEEKRYKDRVIFSRQSKYQRIVLTQAKGDYWLYINGNQQLSTVDEVMYHEPLVLPVMSLSKNPRDILVLGGGDGGQKKQEQEQDRRAGALQPGFTAAAEESNPFSHFLYSLEKIAK